MADQKKTDLLVERFNVLKKRRELYESMWETTAKYILPYRSLFAKKDSEGSTTGNDVFSGNAVMYHNTLADGLQGYSVSKSIRWLALKMAERKLQRIPTVVEWLKECEEVMYSAFQRSNFYEAMHEYFLDASSVGTATMYMQEDELTGKIVFTTCHPWEVYISENDNGEVDTVFRKFDLTYRQLGQKFGLDDLPEEIANRVEKEPGQTITLLHCVYPRDKWIEKYATAKNKRFASDYLLYKEKKSVSESGYDELPYAVWRWKKNTNEVYGRSPATDALKDIKTLNKLTETMLRAAQMSADPPWNIPKEMENVRIRPRGFNYFEETGRTVSPVPVGANYPIGVDREERLEEVLRKHFKVDFFLMLAQSERQMTATEIVEKQGEKAVMLGPIQGRMENDALDPISDYVFRIELEAGRMPEPPMELLTAGRQKIDVDYIGPLAQAQKRLFKTQDAQRFVESAQGILTLSPQTSDHVDWDKEFRKLAEAFGISLKDEEIVEAIRQARAEAEQQMAQTEQLGQMADAAPKLGKKVEEGSILSQVVGGP